jgi:hypothetical protein
VILGFPYFFETRQNCSISTPSKTSGNSRDGWLSNPIFESFEDIVGHCYFAWNKLIDMPWKIISIGIKDSDRDISIDAARCPERRHAQHW